VRPATLRGPAVVTVLVTILGRQGRTDLSISAHVPISEVIPEVVDLCVGWEGQAPGARWAMGPAGDEPFAPELTLADLGVVDGVILELWDMADPVRFTTPGS
jgi:hypothetical protein